MSTELEPPQRYIRPAQKEVPAENAHQVLRQQAEAWVNIVFPTSMRGAGVARIPRNQLDWSIAVAVVQVLFNRNGDLYLLDRVRGEQVCVDTDVGFAWKCSLDTWDTGKKYAVHLNTDDLVFIFP